LKNLCPKKIMQKKVFKLSLMLVFGLSLQSMAQTTAPNRKFEQLGTELPTPNTYRTASGAPGHQYWQQKADYDMKVELNDDNQSLTGSETITYTNNSPDQLDFLWIQMDQNIYSKESDTYSTGTGAITPNMSYRGISGLMDSDFDGGYKISSIKDKTGKALKYTINKTMMRIELPTPMKTKTSFSFSIDWSYNINNCLTQGGRSGYEFFKADGNYLYEMAQFFPRMAVYSDATGWQHKQFIGGSEFTLPFGDYKVAITAPADHVVGATGELKNAAQAMTATQLARWEKAKNTVEPVLIVTQEEAEKAEKAKATGKKTWVFEAKNVRDFAFASSRKFIWDAKLVNVAGNKVWAMSFYPKEGNPLWGKYSTRVVEHTIKTYSKFTIDYTYPVAISVHGPIFGMEYPMICFNGGRPEADGTYSERTKHAMISVIIHEVGHNFFPMIVNSDERQWTWMDEGLNSFVQYLTEQEWQRNYPSSRGPVQNIVNYMKADKATLEPIMTTGESLIQVGNNAYGKPATALNVLRETVMGRELFDYAFKTYAQRWAFKHPEPADLFRTMEDASAVDLDWFWKGWFYTVDNVEISLENVKYYKLDTKNPEVENLTTKRETSVKDYSMVQNEKDIEKPLMDQEPALKDFYNNYDKFAVTPLDKDRYQKFLGTLSEEEKKLLSSEYNIYELQFKNNGGLIMPIILKIEFEDGSEEVKRIPAEIWRFNSNQISKVLFFKKAVKQFSLDPYLETADVDVSNNHFPRKSAPTRFQMFKQNAPSNPNPMQMQREMEKSNKQ